MSSPYTTLPGVLGTILGESEDENGIYRIMIGYESVVNTHKVWRWLDSMHTWDSTSPSAWGMTALPSVTVEEMLPDIYIDDEGRVWQYIYNPAAEGERYIDQFIPDPLPSEFGHVINDYVINGWPDQSHVEPSGIMGCYYTFPGGDTLQAHDGEAWTFRRFVQARQYNKVSRQIADSVALKASALFNVMAGVISGGTSLLMFPGLFGAGTSKTKEK